MDLRDLARANRRQILKCVLQTGGISRSEIARRTGLANSSVTEIIYALMEKRILCAQEVRRNGMRGRPSIVLSLDPTQSLVVVADYSDDQAVAHLADPTGQIVETKSFAFPRTPTLKEYVAAEVKMVEAVGRGHWNKVQGITIVGPGIVDRDHGLLLQNTHLGWGSGQFVKSFQRFGKQTFLQNGSRLRAVAENWYGAAEDVDHFLFFHLDRGIGGAIVLDGILLEGPSHGAGEFGHVVMDPHGPLCPCGARGCLEAIASLPAIVGALKHQGCTSFPQAWALFQDRNKAAVEVFQRAAKSIARCIVNAAIAVGPRTILLGGRMVDQTSGRIVQLIHGSLLESKSFLGEIDLRRCRLPESQSQVVGAVIYALQELDFGT